MCVCSEGRPFKYRRAYKATRSYLKGCVGSVKQNMSGVSRTRKTYEVSGPPKLAKLNGDESNFDLTFTATSNGGEPFELVVVDQNTLDSGPDRLSWRSAPGTLSGNIRSDRGPHREYSLLLRADNPCIVTVEVSIQRIAPVPQPTVPAASATSHAAVVREGDDSSSKIAVAVVVVAAIAVLGYLFVTGSRGETTADAPLLSDTFFDSQSPGAPLPPLSPLPPLPPPRPLRLPPPRLSPSPPARQLLRELRRQMPV